MRTLASIVLLAIGTVGTLPGQAGAGQKAPELAIAEWLRGQPLSLDSEAKAIVLVFWSPTNERSLEALSRVGYVIRQFDKIRAVALTDASTTEPARDKALRATRRTVRYPIALDRDNDTRAAYLDDPPELPTAVVIGEKRRILWSGRPAILRSILAAKYGDPDAAFMAKEKGLRTRILTAKARKQLDTVIELADALIKERRSRSEGWLYKLDAYRQLGGDPRLAKEIRSEALQALSERPDQLARFVTRHVQTTKLDPEDLAGAVQALRRTVRRGGGTPQIRLCLFELAQKSGRQKIASAQARWLATNLGQSPSLVTSVAQKLLADPNPKFAVLADAAVAGLRQQKPTFERLQLEFDIQQLCKKDLDAARAVGRRLMQTFEKNDVYLNRFAWRLLTYPQRKGKFPKLALEAAVMIGKKTGRKLDYYMLDTLALAKFENGFLDDAIELQKKSLESGSATQEYRARLKRYIAARDAKKREKKK